MRELIAIAVFALVVAGVHVLADAYAPPMPLPVMTP